MRRFVRAEQCRAVRGQRGRQRLARGVERADFRGPMRVQLPIAGEASCDPASQAPRAAFGPADDRHIERIREQGATCAALTPDRVEALREGVVELARQVGVDPPAQDMMIEGEARRSDRLQHRIAKFLAIVDLIAVRRLEQEPVQAQHLHQSSIAQDDCVRVDLRRIGQHAAGGALLRRATRGNYARYELHRQYR